MLYYTTFEVVGDLPFPLDMLRYDSCYPDTHEDVVAIEDSFDRGSGAVRPHRVTLRKLHAGKDPRIEKARWASFSWKVGQTERSRHHV